MYLQIILQNLHVDKQHNILAVTLVEDRCIGGYLLHTLGLVAAFDLSIIKRLVFK